MKKIFIITSLILCFSLAGCGQGKDEVTENAPVDTPAPTIDASIGGTVTGSEQALDTTEITDSDLKSKILSVNDKAKVETGVNLGSQMLSIELPQGDSVTADRFFKEVKKVGDAIDIKNNKDYQYYHFTTSIDDNVKIVASFKNVDGQLVADKITAIDNKYESDVNKYADGTTSLF